MQRTHFKEQFNKEGKKDPRLQKNYDKIQALIRTRAYQKDFRELDDLAATALETDNPDDHARYYDKQEEMMWKYRVNALIGDKPDDIIFLTVGDIRNFFNEPTVTEIRASKPIELRDKKGKLVGYDYSPNLVDGKYLLLKIDLTENRNSILINIKDKIDFYRKYVNRREIRNREYTCSPWEVYDLHHNEGLNFSQIARKLSGINENPAYNEKVMAKYKACKRAYSKAKEMIIQAGKKLKKTLM